MTIHVSTSSGVPIYLQIMKQIEQMIATGRLEMGEELPPIRSLAQQLLINPNTVARAYRDLELKGALVTKQGAGTYVAESRPHLSEDDRRRLLGEQLDEVVVLAHQLAIEPDEVVEMIEKRFQPFHPAEPETPRSPFDDEFID